MLALFSIISLFLLRVEAWTLRNHVPTAKRRVVGVPFTAVTCTSSSLPLLRMVRKDRELEAAETKHLGNDDDDDKSDDRFIKVKVLAQQTAVLDGAEWASLKVLQRKKPGDRKTAPAFGCITLVVGEEELNNSKNNNNNEQRTVVGLQVVDSNLLAKKKTTKQAKLYASSVAQVSDNSITHPQAMSTLFHTISLQAVLPSSVSFEGIGIGGSSDDDVMKDDDEEEEEEAYTLAVIGSNDRAVASANALCALGHTVTLVTTNPRPKNVQSSIQVMPPVVGEQEIGFCSALGKLDGILDTLGNEIEDGVESSTIRLLRTRHSCNNYVSVEPQSLAIIGQNGLIWGPGKAKEHLRSLQSQALKAPKAAWWAPSEDLGPMVESLLQKNVKFPALSKEAVHLPGWVMGDFWESTTWPRDAGGGVVTTRYGFPVKDDIFAAEEETFDGMMIAVPPSPTAKAASAAARTMGEDPTRVEKDESPFITTVVGVNGLYEEIVDEKLNAVLFLSAPFCRTCRVLKPRYERMARTHFNTNNADDYTFCKADASGLVGKALGRELKVDSVPTFVLFKQGEQFGRPLSISRLPSAQLDLAITWLADGEPWNDKAMRGLEKKRKEKA